jgi:hypothetical protein
MHGTARIDRDNIVPIFPREELERVERDAQIRAIQAAWDEEAAAARVVRRLRRSDYDRRSARFGWTVIAAVVLFVVVPAIKGAFVDHRPTHIEATR